jgi:FAD/FMN-containing dehydrogenase
MARPTRLAPPVTMAVADFVGIGGWIASVATE